MIGRLDKETKSIIKQSAEAAEMKSETESLRKRVADLDGERMIGLISWLTSGSEELQLYQELRELTRREDILATVDSDGDDSANPPADKETEISMKRLRATLLQALLLRFARNFFLWERCAGRRPRARSVALPCASLEATGKQQGNSRQRAEAPRSRGRRKSSRRRNLPCKSDMPVSSIRVEGGKCKRAGGDR
eukprot:746076-Hanusia_phi.AAC.1